MSANLVFGIIAGLVAIGLIIWVVVIVVRARQVTGASEDRLNARLYAAMNNLPPNEASIPKPLPPKNGAPAAGSASSSPVETKESRLAGLTDLHDRGLISDDELAAARAKILAE